MSPVGSSYIIGQYEREQAASNQPNQKKSMDQDSFLTLLVTQLTHQDPMNPMDDKEMTGQLAQFSSLEQLTGINKGVGSLVDNTTHTDLVSGVNFIGKSVKASGYNISKNDGYVSTVYYGLGEPVTDMLMNVYDDEGALVKSMQLGAKKEGSYEAQWDGTNTAGSQMPDGTYSVALVATDANGEPVMVQTEISGIVDGVVNDNGQQYLRLQDGRYVNYLNVKEVVQTATTGEGDASADQEETEG